MVVAYAEAFSWFFLLTLLMLRYAAKPQHKKSPPVSGH